MPRHPSAARTLRRRIDPHNVLLEGAVSMLSRRLSEAGGILVLTLTLAIIVALASWSVNDPSLNHATTGPVRNLLGRPGAVIADLLMQLFGLASVGLVFPVAVMGWRLLSHQPATRYRLRLAMWVLGAIVFCAGVALIPLTRTWPLPGGFGGMIGDSALRGPVLLLGQPMNAIQKAILGGTLGTLGSILLVISAGFGFNSPSQPKIRQAPPLRGLLGHLMLRARALCLPLPRDKKTRVTIHPRLKDTPQEPTLAPPRPRPKVNPPVPAARIEPPLRQKPAKASRESQRTRAGDYEFPPLTMLSEPQKGSGPTLSVPQMQENAATLEGVLEDFGVRGDIVNVRPGPVVTLYELEPAPGIKSSRVIGLSDDIARSMSAVAARVAVVAGRNAIGIELPNAKRDKVFLRELLAAPDFSKSSAKLPLCLGKTIGGEPVIVDLARMPHLLIAGTTGSGKSVAINTMILSLLYRMTPEECRLIMVDPKMLELSVYDGIPHLLTPVVTDPRKAVVALKWAVKEMEERYKKMSKVGVRNIEGYNARIAQAKAKGENISRTVQTGFDRETGEAVYEREDMNLESLPFIVIIVDEMADLMMVAGKDIEGAIQRLAQMARAAGIHLIMATQRPSVDVITGTIKANFPTRISFQVTSKIDSRTILGEQGAEQLLGQGDMLYMAGGGRISRVHGPFVLDEEVESIVAHLKSQGAPQYLEQVTEESAEEDGGDDAGPGEEGGDLFKRAVSIVMRDRKASTSYIQRRLQIGYNKAASLMERMEEEGIVGAANHAGKREILVGDDD